MEQTTVAAVDSHRLPTGTILRQGILPTALPFALSSGRYMYGLLNLKEDVSPELMSAFKCLPILLLASLAVSKGRSSCYKYLVVMGLLVSAIGDFYLVWPGEDNFIKGMVAFGLAHLFYIIAFGFRGFAPLGLIVACAMAAGATHLLLPKLDGILFKAVPAYIALISLMFWRSLARLHPSYDWCRVAGALGAILFVISDFNLSLNAFYFDEACDYGQLITMVTYYGGQLGIALSVMDRRKMVVVHLNRLAGKSKTH